MADSHAKMTQATPQEIIISVLAGLLAPLLAIFLIVQLVLGIQDDHKPDTSSEAAQKATLARIKPFAQLAALDANAPRVEKSGQEVYDAVCISCHGSGALGAPKFDNKGDWAGRLGQGYDTLVKHAIEGIRQMPPRGGDGDLSDVEVARAVAYMANSGGASFTEPAAAAPAATTDATAPAATGAAAPAATTEAAAPAAPAQTAVPAAAGAPPVAAKAAAPAAAATPPAKTAKAAVAKADPTKGKAVYTASCAVCHAAGVAGAPKLNDKAAWAPRLGQGFDGLYKSALNGKNAMPAKGGNPALPDADLANAVGYMLVEAGGKL